MYRQKTVTSYCQSTFNIAKLVEKLPLHFHYIVGVTPEVPSKRSKLVAGTTYNPAFHSFPS